MTHVDETMKFPGKPQVIWMMVKGSIVKLNVLIN